MCSFILIFQMFCMVWYIHQEIFWIWTILYKIKTSGKPRKSWYFPNKMSDGNKTNIFRINSTSLKTDIHMNYFCKSKPNYSLHELFIFPNFLLFSRLKYTRVLRAPFCLIFFRLKKNIFIVTRISKSTQT